MPTPEMKYAETTIKSTNRKIAKLYRETADKIRADILKMSERMNEFTFAEARKFDRLNSLLNSINENLYELTKKTSKEINWSRETIFENTYNVASTRADLTFGKVNKEFVRQSISKPISGASFADTMKDVTRAQLRRVSDTITRGLIQGQSVRDVAKQVMVDMNTTYSRAVTITNTETLRAMSHAKEIVTEKLVKRGFIVKKQWLTTMDGREREDHNEMNDLYANDEGLFELPDGSTTPAPRLSGVAAQDINCRCDYLDIIIGKDGEVYEEFADADFPTEQD